MKDFDINICRITLLKSVSKILFRSGAGGSSGAMVGRYVQFPFRLQGLHQIQAACIRAAGGTFKEGGQLIAALTLRESGTISQYLAWTKE